MKTLKIRTLDSGYSDPREVILHAAFQCLVDLFEEHMFTMIDWRWNDDISKVYDEMQALYRWWIMERPNRAKKSPLDAYDGPKPSMDGGFFRFEGDDLKGWREACDAENAFERACNEEDKEMLHRLINIREYLWT
jgi:hypothetical protein